MKTDIKKPISDRQRQEPESPAAGSVQGLKQPTKPDQQKDRGWKSRKPLLTILLCLAAGLKLYAQDPVLPPTNLGLANVFDGIAGKPGFVYQGYAQYFHTRDVYDGGGHALHSDLKINSLLQMNQLIYLSPVRVLGGNLGFTVLVPIVQINSSSAAGQAPNANPGVLGDVVQGTAVQWSDKKLFGRPFSHRVEFDVNLPVGNYDSHYVINPSSHLWAYGVYHAFTMMLDDKFSISSRNQFNYNSHYVGQKGKPGAYYNGNYSIDYSVFKSLKVEAAAYYLTQFNQDSYGGDHHYYSDHYGIGDTKERVFGYGPGLAYFAPNGVLIETKVFFETAAKNRLAGSRPTLRIAIPLSK
ncbi:transporter [Mucilaginibacter rubeus]|uniref:Phenol degradation protein meta n=1 Tax=Mucilaginibacter rubeus TaxID=2027860 RepID=A0A5C1I2W1_9SPHI|nr:transporter [Mucilaginibacter rubeus]QEM11728.1 hypothetical protein DEO27_017410 [Mucilaginibacter rubeus]